LNRSLDHLYVCAVTWRPGERRVTGDDWRIERHINGIVRRDVLAQFPRAGSGDRGGDDDGDRSRRDPIASTARSADTSPVGTRRRRPWVTSTSLCSSHCVWSERQLPFLV